MNPDILQPGERCASTSNRNFEGRQGRGRRTHLVSPQMAAAAAIEGHFVDIRELVVSGPGTGPGLAQASTSRALSPSAAGVLIPLLDVQEELIGRSSPPRAADVERFSTSAAATARWRSSSSRSPRPAQAVLVDFSEPMLERAQPSAWPLRPDAGESVRADLCDAGVGRRSCPPAASTPSSRPSRSTT